MYEEIQKIPEFDAHKVVQFIFDAPTNLVGFIAIHRGGIATPAFGATRLWSYRSQVDALRDALNLSKMMSYKSALAGLPYGGGKAVLLEPPKGLKNRKAFLKAYTKSVNFLNGHFITGTDVGLSQKDVEFMKTSSPWMVGLSIDPTEFTGLGILYSLQACLQEVFGSENIDGRTFAIQGVGKIGHEVLKLIYPKSQKIYIADIDEKRLKAIKKEFPNVVIVEPQEIYQQEVDVFAPCALGKSLTHKRIPSLRCKIIVGGANNQLEDGYVGELLHKLGILYAPDYVVNAGGLISVVDEYEHKNHNRKRLSKRIEVIKENISIILSKSKKEKRATNHIADEMAENIFNGHD